MNHALITRALQEALPSICDVINDNYAFAKIVRDPTSHPSIQSLHEALRTEPALDIFRGQMQFLGNQGIRWEVEYLALWLTRRASEAGAAHAVDYLQRYLDASEIPAAVTWALAGLEVLEKRCNLGNNIYLVPWKELPESPEKSRVDSGFATTFSMNWPSAALIQDIVIPRCHGNGHQLDALDDAELRDALLCVGVVALFAPEVQVSWLALPPWVPTIGSGYSLFPHVGGRLGREVFSEESGLAAVELIGQFRALDPATKDTLRLPMERLGTAMRRRSSVDSAVDLGIALEALFLPDEGSELRFRLRLRAARYLEADPERRKRVFDLVGELYDIRSSAVHTGRLPDLAKGGRPLGEVLKEGFGLTASAIRKQIAQGLPDWTTIQLE